MFDMPVDIPPSVVSQQCQVVVKEYIHPASEMIRKSYEERLAKAKEIHGSSESKDKQKKKGESQSEAIVQGAPKFKQYRLKTIMEFGQRLGAQEGLAWRYGQINQIIKKPVIQNALDTTFNFNLVTGRLNVLYPVIEEAKDGITIADDGQSARKTRVTWEITKPARIASTTPTWRDYLYQPGADKHADPVPESLMPVDDEEKALWTDSICKGFSQGARQANLIFSDRLQTLVNDYKGRLRFRALVKMNVVSEPRVIEGRLGVTMAKSGQRVNVDDRMIRIATPALFNKETRWKTVRTLPEEQK